MPEATPQERRLALRIRGRVQGVGYRYSTIETARALGLTGWVRNDENGDVELVAEGPAAALERLVAWCRTGPPGARVTRVDPRWLAYSGEFASFTIRY